jgi:retinol dehydrogenase 12
MAALLSIILESAINKWKTLPDTVVDLRGRTVIVTGSNVGLGLEAAKRFYAMNPARLILAVRTISKGEDAKKVILEPGKKEGPYGTVKSETNIEVWALDLSSFESVRKFAKKCEDELERIDILLENAAVQVGDWSITNDGWEAE